MADKKDEGAESKGGAIKVIILTLLAVFLLAGVGVGAYFLGASGADKAEEEVADGKDAENAAEGEEGGGQGPIGPMVAMDDFIVNVLDAEESRYLKAAMTLELSSPETAAEIEERKPQVRDAILLFLSNKSFDELRDLQGKLQLRADLIGQINGFLVNGKVKTIYFTDFVVQ